VAKVDGVGEPGDGEFNFAVTRFNIFRIFRVPWVNSITYRC